jgi:predicted nucleotidyltransferase component of viral defense system
VLAGIYRDPLLADSWVFKGGTCLKKCYFETYRFSEDLDFTLRDPAQLEVDFLRERFSRLSAALYDETGIELPVDLLRFEVWETARGGRAGEGRISYRGPIAPRGGDLPRIKLDLTADETVVLPPVTRLAAHAYSDMPAEGISARCYAFEELFGEKIRALRERARPRDLYDVINLFRNGEFQAATGVIRDIVRRKCSFKGVSFPTFEGLAQFRDELFADWGAMLRHQLPTLPPVQSFWDALPEFFSWLTGTAAPIAVAAYPVAAGEEVLRVPAGVIRIAGRSTPAIEVIRFAGANRLCVDLDYVNDQGQRRIRTIEPYSLRRTQAGDVLLHAVRVDVQEHRSYRVDRIQDATVTDRIFSPRYLVELTPTGPLSIPEASGRSTGGSGTRQPVYRSAHRPRTARSGPVYVYRCPVCHKRFERKTYDATLNPHKNRDGHPCYGRWGTYEGTKR